MPRRCSICEHKQREKIETDLLKNNDSFRTIANRYGVSEASLKRHKNNGHIGRKIAITEYEAKIEYGSSVLDQLDKINQAANTLLDTAMDEATHNPNIAIQSMREIRNQVDLLMDIRRDLYDIKNVQEFQEEIIALLGEMSKKDRDRFVRRLKERQGIR